MPLHKVDLMNTFSLKGKEGTVEREKEEIAFHGYGGHPAAAAETIVGGW